MARILVIDDNPRFRAMLREALEGVGHEVTSAADGASGIDAFRSSPADLAIVDSPTIDELHQEFPDLKIIAVAPIESVEAGSDVPSSWAAGGAQRSLNKPIRHREMLATVDELLANE